MELKQRIISYIIKNAPVTMDTIIEQATSKGYQEVEVLNTLELVHKDKRIQQTTRGDTVVYTLYTHKEPKALTHITWIKNNYPDPDPWNLDKNGNFIEPFPEIDMSWIVMSPDEIKAFKAEMSGKPVGYNKRYGKH